MNIALIGYGKMGKAIEEIALQRGHNIILKIDVDNQAELTMENLKKADVAIEFTTPGTAENNILKCFEAGVPVVSGTTGWVSKLDQVKEVCTKKNGAFIYSSNYSVGVNIFFELNKKLAGLMAGHDYNVSITETHHTQKKDAPSGTAITLAEELIEKIPGKKNWVNSQSDDPAMLPIISKRIDPAPGIHEINFSSEIDDITIIHTAHNRKGFATGAVLAAEFLKDKKGVFTMKDVLKL